MCIVIDSCCIASLFNPEDKKHEELKPIHNWISVGKGKMIFGGTKFLKELQKLNSYLKFIVEWDRAGKVIEIDKKSVDKIEKRIKLEGNFKRLNDEHLIAIIIVSGCKLVCTFEREAIPFLTNKKFYEQGKKPKVYTGKRNAKKLLTNKYICEIKTSL